MTLRDLLAKLQSVPPSCPDAPVLLFFKGGADDARDVRVENRVAVVDTRGRDPRPVPGRGRGEARGGAGRPKGGARAGRVVRVRRVVAAGPLSLASPAAGLAVTPVRSGRPPLARRPPPAAPVVAVRVLAVDLDTGEAADGDGV